MGSKVTRLPMQIPCGECSFARVTQVARPTDCFPLVPHHAPLMARRNELAACSVPPEDNQKPGVIFFTTLISNADTGAKFPWPRSTIQPGEKRPRSTCHARIVAIFRQPSQPIPRSLAAPPKFLRTRPTRQWLHKHTESPHELPKSASHCSRQTLVPQETQKRSFLHVTASNDVVLRIPHARGSVIKKTRLSCCIPRKRRFNRLFIPSLHTKHRALCRAHPPFFTLGPNSCAK